MERIDEQEEMKQGYDRIVQEIKSVPVVLKPSPKISVGRRYHSPGADLLAEKELEFERQGIAAMKSAEESLKPCGTNRWAVLCIVVLLGT